MKLTNKKKIVKYQDKPISLYFAILQSPNPNPFKKKKHSTDGPEMSPRCLLNLFLDLTDIERKVQKAITPYEIIDFN